MEQLKNIDIQTPNGAQLNLDALYKICPSCFTETAGEDGELKHVVNFEKLRTLLGDNAVEDAPEVYDFTWVGKRAAQREAMAPCRKTLRPCPEESVDWDNTKNLYIEGDNLEVLKLLQNSYMGKVKMIYIDPPYNTGNDFVYQDDFFDADYDEHNKNEDGERYFSKKQTDVSGKLVRNSDSNGRFHSDWCSMMYARLMVARSLLTEDGVIFISIDDNELENLKKISDEVFGEYNFIDIYNWAKTETPENLSIKCRQIIEYVLCYQKNKDSVRFKGVQKFSSSSNGLLNQPNAVGILKFPANKVTTNIPDGHIVAGKYGTDKYDVELLDDVDVKGGYFVNEFRLKAKFKWQQSYLNNEIENGTTISIPTIKFSPSYEKKEYAPEVPTNLINSKVGVETNENAGEYQLQLFPKKVFNFPKPTSLMKYLFGFLDSKDKDYIVMDFFSGSGSTADAVMRINSERQEYPIKYILVQLQENLDESLKNATSSSQKEIIENAIELCDIMKVPHVLTEVAKERIRRAGKKIKEEHPEANDLDIGFRVFKCDESNYKEVAFAPKDYSQDSLDLFVDNIKDNRTDLDLLFDCMLRWGVTLDLPMTKTKVDGCTIYNVNEGGLVACFDGTVTEKVIDAIAEMYPAKVVFRDSSFKEDAQKMNLFEQFKQKCGWTEQEVRKNVRVI